MRMGTVCSGILGAELAAPDHWEAAWCAEIDPFASRVIAHHRPELRNYGDFTTIGTDAGPVDILCGGTPCQSFSVAGRRGGMDDPRGNLSLEFAALAERVSARWILWENVPGVLSSNGGGGMSLPSSGRLQNSGIISPTESWTLSSSASPSAAAVCGLSDILETGDHLHRYCLSEKACKGILSRASRRGRRLSEGLESALHRASDPARLAG